jgi:UDP-N-acetylmuramoylalanine--D-glutamate ligase
MTSRDYFKSKRIAVVGLGPHGEMVDDVKFMIKAGALVSIYDLKSEVRLKSHLVLLRSLGLANYVCGSIPADDLLDMDMIILSHEYPRESTFLKSPKEKKIPIEYPETLFFKLAPPVTVVGVMGACGKSTVISMLRPMIEEACADFQGQGFFVIDADSSDGILFNLRKIKNGDVVLLRIIEPMVAELHALRISPQVVVFTTPPSMVHSDRSFFDIIQYQTYNNYIVANDEVIDMIRDLKIQSKSKMLRTKASLVPDSWLDGDRSMGIRLDHNRESAALALQVAKLFKVDDEMAERIFMNWKPLKGHIEFVKKIKSIEFYNDTASINSCSTEIALRSFADNKNVVLIFGGAKSACDYRRLYDMLPRYAHSVILIPGSGTVVERMALGNIKDVEVISAPSIEEAVRLALEHSKKGDKVLFSPGFESGGLYGSSRERGRIFVRAVRGL